jgi:hypothetical protein
VIDSSELTQNTFEAYNNAPEALSNAVPAIQPSVIGFSPACVDNCRPCMIATTPGRARPANMMIRRAATGPLVPFGTSSAAQQPRARRGTYRWMNQQDPDSELLLNCLQWRSSISAQPYVHRDHSISWVWQQRT